MKPVIYILAFAVLVVLCYLAALVHELGHAGAAWFFGAPVRKVGLRWQGGYIVRGRIGDWRDQVVTLAGPMTNLALWAMAPGTVWGTVNLWCGIVQMVPVWGTDGDRILNRIAGGE
jgi:Zn-dependent protease